ncbi:unnamed protein product [Chilo suppressalis]|uniref:Protein kinase domain-containing protein n=1 Tax=Chilo suppressalis TaxID=168631 RepID=A0ABN8L596_CHISP|nr:unnamed protein product [Chilo suppressalis]
MEPGVVDENFLNFDADHLQSIVSELTSEDDFDELDVVVRHPRRSSTYLLADGGDGAEADLLGTTPPRSRIRNKEIRKTNIGSEFIVNKGLRFRKNESVPKIDVSSSIPDRLKKRASLKLYRARERDFKQDMSQTEHRADALPWMFPTPGRMPAVPTLVESCNRFMCLTSRLKSRETSDPDKPPDVPDEFRPQSEEELPESRVNFHKTFSMLINMGNNVEKGCRRTISREEQVWQNELKDLIWLELQANVAGRTLAQQDAYLCAQRNAVPTILQNIMEYKFVNSEKCQSRSSMLCTVEGSREDLTDCDRASGGCNSFQDAAQPGCLSFNCRNCTDAIGKAMREISTLLDSFDSAVELYPSSKAMTVEHPLIATNAFKNRLRAMCVWFNTALHMRLKVLAVRRMMRSLRLKGRRRDPCAAVSRQSSNGETSRHCQVRFNISGDPSSSSNSEASNHSEVSKESPKDDESIRDDTSKSNSDVETKDCEEKVVDDEVDSGISHGETSDRTGDATPEIVISDTKYGTADTTGSTDSGYSTGTLAECPRSPDVFELGALDDLTRLRLLDQCAVSPYREYHHEMLKTQGVRRCMMFINKLRKNVLHKVHITLEKPDSMPSDSFQEEETVRVFDDTKDLDKAEPPRDEELEKTNELRRYGSWSAECLAMRLPSYRNHFLLLSSICMEAVHDYLSLRLETRPERPSCLTVKQLIHELKEGLDISTEMRHDFVGNVGAALHGYDVTPSARRDLLLVLRTYDATVESVLKQYLSYLSLMSETEHMAKAWLQAEWAFTATLARRGRSAALLAPITFSEITCNQITRLLKEFKNKFDNLVQLEKSVQQTPNRYSAYVMCRAVQEVYARWREPLLQACAWARALCGRLARAHPPAFHAQRAAILDKLMSMREFTLKHTEIVLERTRIPDEELDLTEGLVTRVRELLLQMFKLGFEIHKELQRAVNEVPGRMTMPRRSLANSPPKITLRAKFSRSESIGEDAVFDDKMFDNYAENHQETCIERLLSGEENQQEQVQLRGGSVSDASAQSEEREWAAKVARAVIEFARCWMRFVVERCDRGRGLRPRWASQGLEFLMLACDPCNTKHLSEEEFEELKELMDGCISHVVGSRPRADVTLAPRPRHRLQSPSPSSPNSYSNLMTASPPSAEEQPAYQSLDHITHKKRVIRAVRLLEESRDEKLQEMKAVGRVLGAAVSSYEPRLKQVTFKWQRGLKIGAGTFGKVYTVVNTESGQLLAMKELSIGAGDRRALQRAANELQVLEGVIHPHLVRYYGCELHREEMLIFMELCVEGSLEALVATSGALAEQTVRRYTKQLLSAVQELHSRNIVHRDIKSGNIFLTNEGHCLKLGDFGCAVKIRANTTAPGELQGFVGTQAYMAPEVFMKSSGHGRAADIWSLGCVVTEMASGKRPFSEYDSNYQIMFVVGMGGRPEIPPSLSEEGTHFCTLCLTHDPDSRARASHLCLHHFLMVKNDDDCKCQPAYLIT